MENSLSAGGWICLAQLARAFGVAYDKTTDEALALAVTSPTRSLWDARKGHVHVLRIADGGRVRAVERDALRAFASTRPVAFSATTAGGHRVRFRREAFPCTDEPTYDEEHQIRYRGFAAPNLMPVR